MIFACLRFLSKTFKSIYLPLRFASRQPPPERLARCPMSAYYIVFYDFAFCAIFVNFIARSKQKCASIYHCGSRLLKKKAPSPKRLPQCPMSPYYRVFHAFACLRFLSKTSKSFYHCVSPAGSRHWSDWHAAPCRRTL